MIEGRSIVESSEMQRSQPIHFFFSLPFSVFPLLAPPHSASFLLCYPFIIIILIIITNPEDHAYPFKTNLPLFLVLSSTIIIYSPTNDFLLVTTVHLVKYATSLFFIKYNLTLTTITLLLWNLLKIWYFKLWF